MSLNNNNLSNTQNLNDISNLSKPCLKLNSRENSSDRSTAVTYNNHLTDRKNNSLPKPTNENKILFSQVKE